MDVDDARQLGNEYDVDQVIILYVDREEGELGYVSWGDSKRLCTQARRLANAAYDAVREFLLIHD